MTDNDNGPEALFRPQGTCPKPWIAKANGEVMFDARGGAKRFKTAPAALKAATKATK